MKKKTRIDQAGRIVIPKELRNRYGIDTGCEVQIIPMPDGISIVPVQTKRRLVRQGHVIAIDTGSEVAEMDIFQVTKVRSEHFMRKHRTQR